MFLNSAIIIIIKNYYLAPTELSDCYYFKPEYLQTMASNQEDSLLEDRNHPGVQDTSSAISFVEGTPSREGLLKIPQTSRNATIDKNFACGDMPLSSGSGGTNVLSYSHINTVIPPMPVLQCPMALQNNNMQPHAVSSG